jgi:thioesterase domain-containing protein
MSGDERWHKVAKPALVAATKAYEPRPYSGKVLLVSASDRARELLHPKNGYPALIPHLETVVVEGTHRDVFTALAPGAASKFAGAMSSFLARHD